MRGGGCVMTVGGWAPLVEHTPKLSLRLFVHGRFRVQYFNALVFLLCLFFLLSYILIFSKWIRIISGTKSVATRRTQFLATVHGPKAMTAGVPLAAEYFERCFTVEPILSTAWTSCWTLLFSELESRGARQILAPDTFNMAAPLPKQYCVRGVYPMGQPRALVEKCPPPSLFVQKIPWLIALVVKSSCRFREGKEKEDIMQLRGTAKWSLDPPLLGCWWCSAHDCKKTNPHVVTRTNETGMFCGPPNDNSELWQPTESAPAYRTLTVRLVHLTKLTLLRYEQR